MIVYYIIYPFAWLVGLMPMWAQFGLSAVIRFFIYTLAGYRRGVVRENIRNSFPDYSDKRRKEIEKKFYTQLADVFVDSMALASISEKKVRKRMVFDNSEQFETETQGRSIIVMMAHYGSWELANSYGIHTSHEAIYGVYRPLANKGFDRYYKRCRSRFNSVPIPMNDISKEMFRKRHSPQGVIAALIADQAPPMSGDVRWFEFLNQPTQFFMGGEKMGRMMRMPIYFMNIERVKRGYYVGKFEIIYDGKEQVEEFEITRRYAEKLEDMIVRCPEIWMWSHRRWKRKPNCPVDVEKIR